MKKKRKAHPFRNCRNNQTVDTRRRVGRRFVCGKCLPSRRFAIVSLFGKQVLLSVWFPSQDVANTGGPQVRQPAEWSGVDIEWFCTVEFFGVEPRPGQVGPQFNWKSFAVRRGWMAVTALCSVYKPVDFGTGMLPFG